MSAEPTTTDGYARALDALGGSISEEDGTWYLSYETDGKPRQHILDAKSHDDALFEAWHYLKP